VNKIQFLYIQECPHSEITWSLLAQSLETLGIQINVERIEIHDDLEADHYSFQGSPSIKVDGVDLWEQKRDEYHMGCRVYPTPSGLIGHPTLEMLVERLRTIQSNTTVK
jgi:hypothetical protein